MLAPSPHDSRWRIGFESLETEHREAVELEVAAGAIPKGLDGTLYRIGPGRMDRFGERYHHWFDGDGMVHALALAGGRVTYRNRFVETRGMLEEQEAGRRLYGGFGTRNAGNPIARYLRRKGKNGANTNVVHHAGVLRALWEAGRPHRLDPTTLATLGEDDLGGLLPTPGDAWSAHPRLDAATGELWNFGVHYGRVNTARIDRVDAAGAARRIAEVPLPFGAMLHDFALTATQAVLVVHPFTLPRLPLGLLLGQRSYGESLDYHAELGTRVALVDRTSGEVRWSRGEPLVCFHIANAFDDGNDVVVDLCTYPDGGINRMLSEVMAGAIRTPARAHFDRLRVRPASGTVERRRLAPASFEFPRLVAAAGSPHEHVFGVSWDEAEGFIATPVSLEVESGRVVYARREPGEFAGECVPVRKAGSTAEDDVWVLTLVLDAAARRTELRILDGNDLAAPAVARVPLPHVVPFGFHGSFVPAPAPAAA